MPLRLSPEDQAEYDRKWYEIDARQRHAALYNNAELQRICRQAKSRLHDHYSTKQLPASTTTNEPDYYEESLTLEERIDRIEQHLLIGKYAIR